MSEEKTCKNCRYFLQHYVKGNSRLTFVQATNCGHCTNNGIAYNSHSKYPYVNYCGLWEPIEIQNNRRNESIKSTLRDICEYLEQIATLLNIENDE